MEGGPEQQRGLFLRLFGTFEVRIDGVSIEGLHKRKADRLLAFLALRAWQWVEKAEIGRLLWSSLDLYEIDPNLRQSLAHIRRALGAEAFYLETRTGAVRLCLVSPQADTLRLEAALVSGTEMELRAALEQSEGQLLTGWEDAWIAPFRTQFERKRQRASERWEQISHAQGISRHDSSRMLRLYPTDRPSAISEPVGGAVLPDSPYYIEREADACLCAALARRESIILIKGARQTGKSSLLARGMRFAREQGMVVLETDFEQFSADDLSDAGTFFLRLSAQLADQADQEFLPERDWKAHLGSSTNLESFLRRQILKHIAAPILWALDGVDRLFATGFYEEFFALLRGFHTRHATQPHLGWDRLSVVIATATEAHLYIRDLNQSPFNVGMRLLLEDFTLTQRDLLHERFGTPLSQREKWEALQDLLGGHPYLLVRGLAEIKSKSLSLEEFARFALQSDGPYRDHLERMLKFLLADCDLREAMQQVLRQQPCAEAGFFRLRSAGVLVGTSPEHCRPRCGLYAAYLEQYLT